MALSLNRLVLTNFKNYTLQSIDCAAKLNCFVGKNGMGKTNILDAIHYLCMCKSHFIASDRLAVLHDAAFFRLEGHFGLSERNEKIVCKYQSRQRKIFERNKVPYTRLADHIGLLPLVMIAPDDTRLITEGSEHRRQFLDFTIVQLDAKYLQQLMLYNKIIAQRNAFLKQHDHPNNIDLTLLGIYDEQLVGPATYVYEQRLKFVEDFNPLFQSYYQSISNAQETVAIGYTSPLEEYSMADWLNMQQEKDCWTQRTTKGIHKDELKLQIKGHPVKRFASQGQLKSFLLAMKLAQYEILRQKKGMCPILLLDDIFDKLDASRVESLLKMLVDGDFGQIFITDTHESRVADIVRQLQVPYAMFKVKEGQVELIPEVV